MFQAKQVAARAPLPEPTGGVSPIVVMGEFVTTAASLANNAVIEMAGIPAGTVPVAYTLPMNDLDSNGTPLVSFDVGILSGLYGKNDDTRTIGAQFASGSTIGRTGGVLTDALPVGLMLTPSDSDRGVGIKITAAAATAVVGAKIRLYLTCMSATPDLT